MVSQDNLKRVFRILSNGKEIDRGEFRASADPEELWHDASMTAFEMLREMYGSVEPGLDWLMEVSDQAGNVINKFSFRAEKVDLGCPGKTS